MTVGVNAWLTKLFDSGDIDRLDEQGQSGLMNAVEFGMFDLAHELLDMGANPLLCDPNGITPAILAAFNGHDKLLLLLHKWGADCTQPDARGWTPLMQVQSLYIARSHHL